MRALGAKLNVSHATVHQVLTGKSHSRAALLAVVKALGGNQKHFAAMYDARPRRPKSPPGTRRWKVVIESAVTAETLGDVFALLDLTNALSVTVEPVRR